MATHTSAGTRGQASHVTQTPHVNQTTRAATIINALKQRAQAVLNDKSVDPQSRAIIRYALEINDPWLAELVRRADAGESVVDTIDVFQTTSGDGSSEDKIEALTEMICRAGDEAGTKSAALLVLMATFENATHPKALANQAKHLAFNHCADLNLYEMVDCQIAVVENELLSGDPN